MNFVGKWVEDKARVKNFEDFVDASGMTDFKEEMRKMKTMLEYSYEKEGEKIKWTVKEGCEVSDENGENKETIDKTYTYYFGVPFNNTYFDGSAFSSTVDKIDDNRIKEYCTNDLYGEFQIERNIIMDGKEMVMKTQCKGVTMTQYLRRAST